MARAQISRASLLPTLFRHRSLVMTEAMLCVGLLQLTFNDWVLAHPGIPPWARILLGMVMVIGSFGGILFWTRGYLTRTLSDTHNIVRTLPFPTPKWLFHGICLGGLYVGYTLYWSERVGGVGRVLPFP